MKCSNCGNPASKNMFVRGDNPLKSRVMVDLCDICYRNDGVAALMKEKLFKSTEQKLADQEKQRRDEKIEWQKQQAVKA